FEPWNPDSNQEEPHSGRPIVDTGSGWVDEDGNRYFFVAYWTFWQRWRSDILPGLSSLSQAYMLTGEEKYGHAAAILLARIAGYYGDFHYSEQSYHSGRYDIHGRICDRIWENGTIGHLTEAYDGVFPIFEEDDSLRAFLREKGIDDPVRHMDQEMLNVMADDLMRGFIRGNTGMYQRSLARVAIVLDNDDPEYGPTTEEMREWIMTGSGDMEYLLWNGFYRDGHGGESSPSYSCGWCRNFYLTADLLPKLGVNIWDEPKVKKMADIGLDLAVNGEWTPSIGDCGNIFSHNRVCWSAALQGRGFDHYKDSRHAAALKEMDPNTETLWNPLYDEQELEAFLDEHDPQLTFKTRNVGGYGLAILESGEEPTERGLSMYYGFAGGGHGHYDRLTIEMHAFDQPMLTEMGYPAHWGHKANYWSKNTPSHYCVLVDQHRQESMGRGYLNTLASLPGLQLADAEASHSAYPSCTSMYRRTIALIDINPRSSYALDIFRVRGGRQHDYSFHGPPFPDFSVSGFQPGPKQEKGTLLGEDIEFGSDDKPKDIGPTNTVSILLQQAEGLVEDSRGYREKGHEGWSKYRGNHVLTDKEGAELRLPLPDIDTDAFKLFLNVHNYQDGENVLKVTVGDVSKNFEWGSDGQQSLWLSQTYENIGDAEAIVITAEKVEQPWALITQAGLTTDLEMTRPQFYDVRTSGYQYLFDVRRGHPEGGWSATWADPESGLALTMTAPAESMEEVILAKAEAELKPRHPDTLDYVLGRNVLSTAGDGELASDYIVAAEPHRGEPGIRKVERLEASDATRDVVGVTVHCSDFTDYIHSATDASAAATWNVGDDTFSVTGEYALVRVDGRGVRSIKTINCTRVQFGELAVEMDAPPAGKVLSVDHDANTITIDTTLQQPEQFLDRVAILGNEMQQTSYTIKSVEVADGKTTLGFGDVLCLVQMGPVEEINHDEHSVKLGKLGRVDGRDHEGRWLYNEDRSVGLRIAECRDDVFVLESYDHDLNEVFQDFDGDGRVTYWVSDIGVGDDCRLPSTASIEREGSNVIRVRTSGDVEVRVPDTDETGETSS
ncbi:MAG: heparinase II/III family protein, partial [Armatimonadota bacterium]